VLHLDTSVISRQKIFLGRHQLGKLVDVDLPANRGQRLTGANRRGTSPTAVKQGTFQGFFHQSHGSCQRGLCHLGHVLCWRIIRLGPAPANCTLFTRVSPITSPRRSGKKNLPYLSEHSFIEPCLLGDESRSRTGDQSY
jgi:hypothetical protein